MNIFFDINEFKPRKKVVLTPGTFDGVHLGHQKILTHINTIAEQENMESVVLTFSPHPKKVLFPDSLPLKLIDTLDEKIEKFKKTGVQNLIIYPFTKTFSRISALEYVRDFLVNELKVSKLVVGYDHQFGRNREGNFEYLTELSSLYDFEVEEISAEDINDINISSTKIRKAIEAGNIALANEYLGAPFLLSGTVVEGKKIGHTLGYPTANIAVDNADKIIPPAGVYAVKVEVNGSHHGGVLSIGTNPTVSNENTRSVEVFIFDFNADIYSKKIKVTFVEKLRDEEKFNGLEELKDQIARDVLLAKQYV